MAQSFPPLLHTAAAVWVKLVSVSLAPFFLLLSFSVCRFPISCSFSSPIRHERPPPRSR